MSTDPITILDGGTGRELLRIGAPFRQPEWSALALIEAPEYVARVHRAFIEAGADVITTNSYALVPFHVGSRRFSTDGARLAALAGTLARAAVGRGNCRVAGSLPPVCGSYRADRFEPAEARPVLEVLTAALAPSVDLWLAETLSTTAEAMLVREILGSDQRPLWLSFTLKDESAVRGDPRLRSGQSVAAAVAAAVQLGAAALLFNCSQPEVMADALADARGRLREARAEQIRIGAYANAFEPQPTDAAANEGLSEIRGDLTPAGYRRFAEEWVNHGATIVGGCCGIGPEHVRALADRFRTSTGTA